MDAVLETSLRRIERTCRILEKSQDMMQRSLVAIETSRELLAELSAVREEAKQLRKMRGAINRAFPSQRTGAPVAGGRL